jgi:hypothetical protein
MYKYWDEKLDEYDFDYWRIYTGEWRIYSHYTHQTYTMSDNDVLVFIASFEED